MLKLVRFEIGWKMTSALLLILALQVCMLTQQILVKHGIHYSYHPNDIWLYGTMRDQLMFKTRHPHKYFRQCHLPNHFLLGSILVT